MKEVRFSQHSLEKIQILANRGIAIEVEKIKNTVLDPQKIESSEEDKKIAQTFLNEKLVLRVVYREFPSFIYILTLYPGRRSRYE